MSVEYKVSRVLWESLESVLLAQAKKYVSDLAKILEVPEKQLIKEVLPSSDSLKIYIQDSSSDDNKCKAYIQNENITEYCRKPVAYGSEFCCIHRERRMLVFQNKESQNKVEKIKDRNDLGKTWIKDTYLVNSKNEVIGKINKDKEKIKIFILKS